MGKSTKTRIKFTSKFDEPKNEKEIARRLKQIQAGKLQVSKS